MYSGTVKPDKKALVLTRFKEEFRYSSAGFFINYVIAYVLTFISIYPLIGMRVVVLCPLLVIAAGWFWGMRGGMIAGFLGFPFNAMLGHWFGEAQLDSVFWSGLMLGMPASIMLGAWVGHLCDMGEKLKREHQERLQAQEELQKSRENLKDQVREKEMLLQEIHHRVKNNMQIICSLLNLQSRRIKSEYLSASFQDCQNRIRSMAFIHEMLYRSRDLAKIEFAEYVQTLSNYLSRIYHTENNGIAIQVNINGIYLGIEQAIPCGLIVNELVSNALKHAFPDGRKGEIGIRFTTSGGKSMLAVHDNGIGLPQGIDFRESDSLGMELISVLVQQLEGSIELNVGEGTKFSIVFPN